MRAACAVVVCVCLVLLVVVFADLDLICCFGFCSGFCLVCVRLLGLMIVAFRVVVGLLLFAHWFGVGWRLSWLLIWFNIV